MSLRRLRTAVFIADQDKTCATQMQTLNPDKDDSVWKRRTRIPGGQCHASRCSCSFGTHSGALEPPSGNMSFTKAGETGAKHTT